MSATLTMGPVVLGRNDNGAERFKVGQFWLSCVRKGLEPTMIRDESGPVTTVTVVVTVPVHGMLGGLNVWA